MSRKKEAYSPTWIEQGKRIKELRTAKGFSQIALARLLHYETANTVYYWENGRSGIDYKQLSDLSKIFDVDIGYITGNQDHKNIADLISRSKRNLELLTPECMKEHDKLADLFWRFGYDLAILEIDNSNFLAYIKRRITGKNKEELQAVINDAIFDYEMLKEGFKQNG